MNTSLWIPILAIVLAAVALLHVVAAREITSLKERVARLETKR